MALIVALLPSATKFQLMDGLRVWGVRNFSARLAPSLHSLPTVQARRIARDSIAEERAARRERMSIAGIASSTLSNYSLQAIQSNPQKWQQGPEPLGQNRQPGHLSAAQSEFAALQKLTPQTGATSSTQGASAAAQDLNQLGKDLQAGNTTAAQQDLQQLQQKISPTVSGGVHHPHHRGAADTVSHPMGQVLQQLGQALQAGNLSDAQQTYTVLQQQLQTLGQTDSTPGSSTNLTVNA